MAEVKNMLHKVQHLFLSTSVSAQSWRREWEGGGGEGDRKREERGIKNWNEGVFTLRSLCFFFFLSPSLGLTELIKYSSVSLGSLCGRAPSLLLGHY